MSSSPHPPPPLLQLLSRLKEEEGKKEEEEDGPLSATMRGLVKRLALVLLLPAVVLLYGGDVLLTVQRSLKQRQALPEDLEEMKFIKTSTLNSVSTMTTMDSASSTPVTSVTGIGDGSYDRSERQHVHARVALLANRPQGASQIRHRRSRLAHARERTRIRIVANTPTELTSEPSANKASLTFQNEGNQISSPSIYEATTDIISNLIENLFNSSEANKDSSPSTTQSAVIPEKRVDVQTDDIPFSFPHSSGPPNLEIKLKAQGDLLENNEDEDELREAEEELEKKTNTLDKDKQTRHQPHDRSLGVDVVTKFLKIVESQHLVGENCTAGTDLTLEEGVVDRYAQEKFRLEADVAVNRANFLTRLWKNVPDLLLSTHYILYADIRAMIEFDDDIFAAGNCYDKYAYADYWLFCPFAYRVPDGSIVAKDLSVEYKYLSNTSEWFYRARKSAERVIRNFTQFRKGYNSFRINDSQHGPFEEDEILSVTYEDGKWSKPYFDCGGGNIWMMTYTVPFFGYNNGTYTFKGTSGIDIDLRRVDIDQCPPRPSSTELNLFAASDKCKTLTTRCVAIPGLGFRRGSYKCVCKDGYYYPIIGAELPYFNGTVLEEEYEKKMLGEKNLYDDENAFECLPCPEGCETCVDDRPCVVSLNWAMRSAILALTCIIMSVLPLLVLFTWKYGEVKVVKAASPVLLRFIIAGAFLLYGTIIVMYFQPTMITCTIRVWLREVGFALSYGALMLKTWRISVIFRVRSAKAIKITDVDLLKGLGFIVGTFTVFLSIRTIVNTPRVIVGRTTDDLKAYLCSTDWWDHSFTLFEMLFLVWGIRLCIVVRKAPSEFNESKFISLAIYNEFLLSVFLNISMLFLQSPANPDLLFIIFFCHSQLTITLLLCLIFGSKAYLVLKGHGKAEDATTFATKPLAAKFLLRPKSLNSTHMALSSTTSVGQAPLEAVSNSVLTEADVQEEFKRLYTQLEVLKEKNMRLGNRHLAAKINAMQEAARRDYADGHATSETSTHQAAGKGSVCDVAVGTGPMPVGWALLAAVATATAAGETPLISASTSPLASAPTTPPEKTPLKTETMPMEEQEEKSASVEENTEMRVKEHTSTTPSPQSPVEKERDHVSTPSPHSPQQPHPSMGIVSIVPVTHMEVSGIVLSSPVEQSIDQSS